MQAEQGRGARIDGIGRMVPRAWIAGLALVALSGCITGHLPTLTTERIDVNGIDQRGIALHVRVIATNERHSETISIDALRVHVTVGDQDLGTVDVAHAWELPPNQPVLIETDILVPIANLPALAMQAASGPVPYHLDGRAHVLNLGWSVDFSYDGQITQQQILGAAMPALPFGFP